MSNKILLGLSGGIDSTIAVKLLKDQGFDILGIYLKMHNNENYHKNNLEKIEKISKYFGIKYEVEDIREEFNKFVYQQFIEDYKLGIQPNPCISCNRDIKFGFFINLLEKYNYDKIASGHYIRTDGEFLYTAKDISRDQTFFLSLIILIG